MSFLNKLGIGIGVGSETSRDISRPALSSARARTPGATAAAAGTGPARAPDPRESARVSNGWKEFLREEEARVREDAAARESLDMTANGRAKRFLAENLQYPRASFDAVLLWDLLDYLEPVLVKQIVATLTELLRPGGVVFAMFHSKKPEGFQRYRVADSNTLQMISTAVLCPAQKVYQNREIQDLFGRFRTMKSFVGRDQLRETLFIK